jgi:16S rRNA C967 or C1407 C5-methylase (RsmB/RsmF family)
MEEIDLAEAILADITEGDTSFSEALRKVFQADVSKRPFRGTVAGLVGCELRHHLLFSYLSEPFKDYTPADKRVLGLGLSDAYFFKRIPTDQLLAALKEKLGEAKLAEAQSLLDKAGKPEEFIPIDLQKTSNKYLSLRYNTPEWVLKIWEHYGYGTTFKILKKNNHQNTTSVRVRTSLVTVDEILNNNPDYAKTGVEGMLYYGGKEPLRKLPEFRDNKIFAERLATKDLVDKFMVEEPSEAFFYDGNEDSSLLKEAIESYQAKIGLNLGVGDLNGYVDVTRMIRDANLKNVNFFAADPSALEASISRPQELVVCAPASSNFDLIREYPDYLLHFKKEAMDALFAKEKATLEGTSKFVAEHGTLIYLIYTISKKEGHQTIADFVLAHPEFKIVREAQLFPFEELDTAVYYCVMRKDTALAKANPPLPVLVASAPSVSATSAAKADEAEAAKEEPASSVPEEAKAALKEPLKTLAPEPAKILENEVEAPALTEPAKAVVAKAALPEPAQIAPAEAPQEIGAKPAAIEPKEKAAPAEIKPLEAKKEPKIKAKPLEAELFVEEPAEVIPEEPKPIEATLIQEELAKGAPAPKPLPPEAVEPVAKKALEAEPSEARPSAGKPLEKPLPKAEAKPVISSTTLPKENPSITVK